MDKRFTEAEDTVKVVDTNNEKQVAEVNLSLAAAAP